MGRLIVLISAGLLAACGARDGDGKSAANRGRAASAAASMPAAKAPTALPAGPDQAMVQRLNALEMIPEGAAMDAYFAADISAAMKKDMAGDEVGAVSYDYRWNAQDFEVSDVSYQTIAVGDGRGRVVVTFRNFGDAGRTTYDMCRRADGQWRIYDVRSNDADDGSLRHALGLKRGEVTQC